MLTYKIETVDGVRSIVFHGDIDIEATEIFQDELFPGIAANRLNYEISLKHVGFVDSTGIGFILQLIEKMKERGLSVAIVDIQQDVQEVFHMLQISEIVGHDVFAQTEIIKAKFKR